MADDPTIAPSQTSLKVKDFTRFERARIVGARALQIGLGAPILVKVGSAKEALDPVSLAEREFEEGVVPITVLRPESMTK